jgi:hypothetical protein
MERKEIYKVSDKGTVTDRVVIRGPSINSQKVHSDKRAHIKVSEQSQNQKENSMHKYARQLEVFNKGLPEDTSMQISYPFARRTAN